MSSRYTADGKRKSSMTHARYSWTCDLCDKTVFGNGGQTSHMRKHIRAAGLDPEGYPRTLTGFIAACEVLGARSGAPDSSTGRQKPRPPLPSPVGKKERRWSFYDEDSDLVAELVYDDDSPPAHEDVFTYGDHEWEVLDVAPTPSCRATVRIVGAVEEAADA